jgi:two-component system nitrate/nitrite response regulator NarL
MAWDDKQQMTPTPALQRIHICLLEDHRILSEGLAMMLGGEPDITVVALCQKVADATQVALSQHVDLFLVDLRLQGEEGFGLLEMLHRTEHPARVVVLAAEVEVAELVRLVSLGASGIILKKSPPGELLRCIRSVAAGEAWLDQNHLNALLHELSRPHREESEQALTDREKTILRSLLQGLSNKQIAERMSIRETAVKSLLQTLFRKTGVHARSQLVRVALEKYREELGS